MSDIKNFFNNLDNEDSGKEQPRKKRTEEVEDEDLEQDSEFEEEDEEQLVDDEEQDSEEEDEEQPEDDEGDVDEEEVEEETKKYADIFNSVEDLEKAYKELQRKSTQDSQKLSQILTQQQQQAQGAQGFQQTGGQQAGYPQSEQIPPELASHPEFQQLQAQNPQQASAVVQQYKAQKAAQQQQSQTSAQQQQLQKVVLNQEILSLRQKYSDFDEIAEHIPNVLQDMPHLWNTPNPVETAYKIARADKVDEVVEKASASAKKEASEKRSNKKKAKTEKQKAKTPNKKKPAEDQISDEILSARGGGKNAFF